MAYATFSNKWSVSADDGLNEDTHFNNPGQGIQDELEERRADLLDGVVSGFTLTTSGGSFDTITIAAGDGIVAGKRYTGNDTVSMSGKASGSYYCIIDSADDVTPYKVQTGAPASGELCLGTCGWDGSAFIAQTIAGSTAYLDNGMRVQGVQRYEIGFSFPGTLSTDLRWIIPIDSDSWIEDFHFACVSNGSVSGSVTLDLLLGADGAEGTTVFASTGRRPTITTSSSAYTIASMGNPDGDRMPDAGEHLTVAIDAIDGGGTASTCSGTVVLRYR